MGQAIAGVDVRSCQFNPHREDVQMHGLVMVRESGLLHSYTGPIGGGQRVLCSGARFCDRGPGGTEFLKK